MMHPVNVGGAARRAGGAAAALLVAVLLTLLSTRVQRRGPEQVVYGNLCGPTMSDLCYKPVLKGGYPIAFLFDAPGVSVEDQLSFGEDHVRLDAFAADVAVYLVVLIAIVLAARRSLAPRAGFRHR